MLVLRLEVRHFRGFAHAVVLPRGHALVVGEPRAGRSDLLAALKRVLDPDATKAALEEWDFHGRDLGRDIEIEVVLGELAPDLRQRFLGELEFWDPDRKLVLPGSDTTQQLAGAVPVLRLAYRGRWNHAEEAGEHWVAFAKSSDPDADQFKRVPRADRAVLPFLARAPAGPWRSPPRRSSVGCWNSAAPTTSPRRCATWSPGWRTCRPSCRPRRRSSRAWRRC